MTREEAIKICKQVRKYFKGGKLATDDTDAIYGALTEAIEALTENPKFTQVYIETDVYWLERQIDMYKEKIYLNEQTMIVYVPFVTAELVEACGGTIKRRGEE